MTISVKMLNDRIKQLSDTNTLLDMLLEFEKVLDNLDIYSYKNWEKGEVLEGPILERHFVTVKLLYAKNDMPDPDGAKRLIARDCKVKFEKDTLVSPVKIRNFDDVITEIKPDGTTRFRARKKSEPVWVVTIKMPRRFVDEFSTEVVEVDQDTYIDTEELNTEDLAAAEQQNRGGM